MKYRIKQVEKKYPKCTRTEYFIQYKVLWMWFDYKFDEYCSMRYGGFHLSASNSLKVTFTNLEQCKEIVDFLENNQDKDIIIGWEYNQVYIDKGSAISNKMVTCYTSYSPNLDTIKKKIAERKNKEYNNTALKTTINYI